MARPGKVWWNAGKGAWYSTIAGKKTRIADGDKTHAEAEDIWHQFHAKEIAASLRDLNPLWVIFDLYLAWVQEKHPASYNGHRLNLQSFLNFHGKALRVADLNAVEVARWLYYRKTWSDGTKWLAMSRLQACLNWAANPVRRLIDRNPIDGLEKPSAPSRGGDVVIPPEVHDRIYAAATPAMRDILFFLRQTGTRPINLCRLEAAHCDFEGSCIRLPMHKTRAHTGEPLLIPITEALKPLLQRLCAQHPTGLLFRNRRGRPYETEVIDQNLKRLCKRIGLEKRPILYGYRHTVATELLLAGVPDAQVAQVLGHRSTTMLHRHYNHLGRHIKGLAGVLDRVVNGDAGKAPAPQEPPVPVSGENAT